jgi:hypothetical protein
MKVARRRENYIYTPCITQYINKVQHFLANALVQSVVTTKRPTVTTRIKWDAKQPCLIKIGIKWEHDRQTNTEKVRGTGYERDLKQIKRNKTKRLL